MNMQKTIKSQAAYEGIGLHTGNSTKITFKTGSCRLRNLF